MAHTINEIDNKYGRLTVIEKAGKDKWGNILWKCKCDCGNITITQGTSLRRNLVRSCGCLAKENAKFNLEKYRNRLPKGEAAFRDLLRNMKQGAKYRNLKWTLTDEEVRDLIQKPCYYCGKLPENHLNNKDIQNHCRGDFPSNGLDRIDNSKGYTIDNVVSCCYKCNAMKEKQSISEFRNQITKIYKYWIENGDS